MTVTGIAGLLGACTTSIATRPDLARTARDEALPGVAYALPMLQYEITTSYKIVDCPRASVRNAQGVETQSTTELEIVVTPTATSDYVAAERYAIDHRALTNIFKITDFTIETYAGSGTLKSLNASVEDTTGDVIKSVVDTAISGASMLSGASKFSGASFLNFESADIDSAKVTKLPLECTAAALALVDAQAVKRKRVRALDAELTQGGKTADTITARATLKLSASNDGPDLLKLHAEQLRRSEELVRLQAEIAEGDAKVSFIETIRWPKSFSQLDGPITSSARLQAWAAKWLQPGAKSRVVTDREILRANAQKLLEKDAADKLGLRLDALAATLAPDTGCNQNEAIEQCVNRAIGLYASLQADQPALADCPPAGTEIKTECLTSAGTIPARDATPDKGVFVREPIRARLVLCGRSTPCADTADKPLFEGRMLMAPQLGQLRYLSFTNGPFQNNALSLSLRTDGGIIKMQYAEKSAIAATSLASISSSAGKLDEYVKKREEEQQKALDDARADVAAARVEARSVRDEELAQLQYQFDKAKREKEIFEQANPKPSEEPAVAKEVANENLRLQAELTRLTTLVAIREAMLKYGQ